MLTVTTHSSSKKRKKHEEKSDSYKGEEEDINHHNMGECHGGESQGNESNMISWNCQAQVTR